MKKRTRDPEGKQDRIIEFFAAHSSKSFTAKEVAEKLGFSYKYASSALFVLFGKGCLTRRRRSGRFRYRLPDDVQIPKPETAQKPEEKPLSPFWKGMAIWDSAVKTAVKRSEHSQETFS